MINIALIFTDHKERGICNSQELCNIIKQVSPDIIFEEIHQDLFDSYYKESIYSTLETNAIKLYLNSHSVTHIPVDWYNLNEVRREYIQQIFDAVDATTTELSTLWSKYINLSAQYGFTYLNSPQCTELLDKKMVIVESELKKLNNSYLLQVYKNWINIQDGRENIMLKNIYTFNWLSNFKNGIFFIGAEHRKSILEKINKFENSMPSKINWVQNIFNQA